MDNEGGGSVQGIGGGMGTGGGSPVTRAIGPGGFPMRKKVMPKKSPKKLSVNKNWKRSFNKFATKMSAGGKRGG